ncbi:hypothetical protein GETHPA_18080 [Geothrix rubra]|uniref:Hemerythrin-like domain-containing protein n=1 Tax=Geothrix rubra TaxID=2927977 RepID=A0ABQ5Q7A3_9BACT|nr:hemerythrin domain-containing protein [Geothrix rubra]GLH70275.1 hypothetical protein GETHPA_18080 [Geothrix rubra]
MGSSGPGPGPSPLTARLAADHGEIDGLIHQATEAFGRGSPGEAHATLDRLWMRLAVHIRAEHRVLFPALSEVRPDLRASLGLLRADHDGFMATLAGAVKALEGLPQDLESARAALEAVRKRLAPHNRLEEERIYPAAGTLPPALQVDLLEAVSRELAALPARYTR